MSIQFYCRLPIEQQKFYGKGESLFKASSNGMDKKIYSFNENIKEIRIIHLVEFANQYVILVNWEIPRNILCFEKVTDKLLWIVEPPKKIFDDTNNQWGRILKNCSEEDRVYCISKNQWRAAYDLKSGERVWEFMPDMSDPRDF